MDTPSQDRSIGSERSGASSAFYHRLAANPAFYDFIQRMAGVSAVCRQVAPMIQFAAGARVLDVGGGTGVVKTLMGAGVRHVCVDLEREKLTRYVSKFDDALPIQADAAALPFCAGSVDAVTLALVTHHFTEPDLHEALGEIARVLKPAGVLVLYDPVWAPSRLPSRLLWKYDRGSHPRTADQIAAALLMHFRIVSRHEFAVMHRYAAFLCRPREAAGE
jgi:ubiquinone/menaquinone biosynthesis C-methylase UbiE